MFTFAFNLIITMLVISGISMGAVALYARKYVGRVRAATPYVLLIFAAGAWSILYALDLLETSLPLKIMYHNLRFLFLPFFSVLEVWLVIAYVNRTEWLRRDWAALALIIPVISAILAVTSPLHSLFRYNFSLNVTGPVPVLEFSESGFYTFYSVYSLLLLIFAVLLLIIETRRKGILWQPQTLLLIIALAFPTIINYTSVLGFTPVPGVNMAPVLLWIPAVLYTIALFRFQFLDIVPIARSRLIEALSKPVLVLDTNGRIIDINPAACALFAMTANEALGRAVESVVTGWPEFLELCYETVAKKRDLVRTKDGVTHYYIGSGEPLKTPSGEIEGHLIFLQDVTELKMAEAALRESEAKYRAIINDMQDLFYRTDINGKITMLSPSAIRIAGYDSIDQLIGRDVTSLYANPTDRETFLAALREKGSVYAYPVTLKTRDGGILHVTTSSHFYRDKEGNIGGVEGVIHDITEQRRAEDALRIANKKLHLLSSITRHDIRNQLMALMAFIELSKDAINKPEELADFLRKNQKIAETITEQITFTKEYEDLGIKAPLWQDVTACIGRAVTGLPMRDIRIRTEIPGLEIFADPLVERVFYNLVDNALRYGGGRMTTIRITSRTEGSSLVLVFEDDGEGVAEQDKKAIFDKGYGKNTGLGLYLSREILSITGITITETGEPGKGARFEILIPEGAFRFVNTAP
jgi:PAS domain S-box-containing protein